MRKQAIERFRLRPDRVVAVPEAAAPWFGPVEPKAPGGAPYFLFVGTLEPRKNLAALVEAWREVRQSHPVDLVLAGRKRADFADTAAWSGEPGLRWIGEAPDAALPELYSGALALVYPSLYEGFGLPVLEAMQCGACVIASRAVEEAAGDAAIYATGAREMAQAMRALCENPERVAELRGKSLERARQFTWERTAHATYEVYREARRRFAE